MNLLLDSLFYNRCYLICLHIFVILIIKRPHEVYLHGHRTDRVCVKWFERINQRNRDNRAFCLGCCFEASSFKIQQFIAVFGTSAFCKDQIISSSLIMCLFTWQQMLINGTVNPFSVIPWFYVLKDCPACFLIILISATMDFLFL